jgi:arsenite methyltransferase
MTTPADSQASLEGVLKDEIIRMYQEVADDPSKEFHFFHGREAAELFEYEPVWRDRAPAGAVASFAGVGNAHLRSDIQTGETVLDLGSGAGLDAIIASWKTGTSGQVIGVDLNPAMCLKIAGERARHWREDGLPRGNDGEYPRGCRIGRRRNFEWRHQPVVPEAAGS